jgi:ribosomal protein S18 acetylase RimI-like enzyme
MQWMVGPTSRPSDLGPRLEAHALARTHGLPMMALDLREADLEPIPVPGLTIEPVADRESRAEWLRPFGASFGMPDHVRAAFSHLFLGQPADRGTPMRSYLGRLRGRASATATVLFAGGVAGVFNVGVVPEAREKGIGAAMTLTALQGARELGYRVGVLGAATEIAARLYRKLGFRHVCTLLYFTWADGRTEKGT